MTMGRRPVMNNPNKSFTRFEVVGSSLRMNESDAEPLLTSLESADRASSAPPNRLFLFTLVFVAGIGGFLFGYDTGVISGALPYIRDDLLIPHYGSDETASLDSMQEFIVSSAILAAALSSVLGGRLSDMVGRKKALYLSDGLFSIGSLLMASATSFGTIVFGRISVGLGIGLASTVVPAYIAECAPASMRARLVTMNVFMITTGQCIAYVVNYGFSFVAVGNWRWMLGVAAVPAALQGICLLWMPESPTWLHGQGRHEEARQAQNALRNQQSRQPEAHTDGRRISIGVEVERPGDDVSIEERKCSSMTKTVRSQLLERPVLRALHIGVGLQILQQTTAINTAMYYTPSILQLAGIHDKQKALLWSTLPAGVNALGTLVGMHCIDKYGRRRLLLTSLIGVAIALTGLGAAFYVAETHSPLIKISEGHMPVCGTTPVLHCSDCIAAGCGYCGSNDPMDPGTCLPLPSSTGAASKALDATVCAQTLFTVGCPSHYSKLILVWLLLYLAVFSPGLGPVPWAVNSEIYPVQIRGLCLGIAATANWISNALVAQTFLTLTRYIGGSGAFWSYGVIALVGVAWTHRNLPETNGLSHEQIQSLLQY